MLSLSKLNRRVYRIEVFICALVHVLTLFGDSPTNDDSFPRDDSSSFRGDDDSSRRNHNHVRNVRPRAALRRAALLLMCQ